MGKRTDINVLLTDEDFQDEIIGFDSLSKHGKKSFIDKYDLTRSEFIKARQLIAGLTYKGVEFSESELNQLWKSLRIGNIERKLPYKKSLHKNVVRTATRVAAILSIPLLVGTFWFAYKASELQSFKDEKVEQLSAMYNTVFAPPGGKTKAVLPDGSEVWLNSGSSIQYPLLARDDYREVKLSGEGFFKVVKNTQKPMLVSTSGMQIRVYGTTFNVNAYEDQLVLETALVEGRISIVKLDQNGNPVSDEYHMKPGELGKLNRKSNSVEITKTGNLEAYTGWVGGKHIFKNIPFGDILKRLQRIYNVELVLEDEQLGNYNFDATFNNQSIDDIMKIFAVSLPIKCKSEKIIQNADNTFAKRRIIITRDKSKTMQ